MNKSNKEHENKNKFLKDKLKKLSQKIDDIKKENFITETGEPEEIILDEMPTQSSTNAVESGGVFSALEQKQNTLTAGVNISISGNTISATDTTYSAGSNITISNNVISATDTTYTAGNNVTISDGIISATDTTYTAGTGLSLSGTTFSADTTTLATKTDLAQKQDVLTAGSNISINNGTISATDTTYTAGTGISIANGVISATVQGGGSSDLTDLENRVDQNTSDIEYLKRYVVAPDPYYTGQTPSDYPAGTILQTYDNLEQIYNFDLYTHKDYPTIYFCAEPNSIGNINFSFDYTLLNKYGRMMVDVILNGTSIFNENIVINDINQKSTFHKTLYDVQLNSEERGNSFVLSVSLENITGFYVMLETIRFEISAPNADILSKIIPYDVTSIKNIYYLTDCSSGNAKIANINANDIYNIESLQWQDMNLQSIYMQTCFDTLFYNSKSVMDLDNIGYLYLSKANRYYIQKTDGSYKIFSDSYNKKWFPSAESSYCLMGLYSDGKLTKSIVNCSSGSTSFYHGRLFSAVKVICGNALYNYFDKNNIGEAFLSINQNGIVTFHNSFRTTGTIVNEEIGYASDATMYYKDFVSQNEFKFECYLKVFDKIIKKEFQYVNGQLNLLSTLEIGKYDLYFAMPNNDYFVYKNRKLLYFKN